jgi:hypothetical protein
MRGNHPVTTPALEQLMGAYFHQDFDLFGDDHMDVVDQFVIDDPNLAARLPLEVFQLMDATPDDDELEARLEAMGCQVYPQPREDSYRQWLNRIVGRVQERLSS